MRSCRFCHSEALNPVRRTVWQRGIFKKVYRCRGCGQREYMLRFSAFWLHDGIRSWGVTLGKVRNVGRRVTDTVGVHQRRYLTSRQ